MVLPAITGLVSISGRALLGGGRGLLGAAARLAMGGMGRGGVRSNVRWHGARVQRNIRTGMTRRVNLAAQLVRDQAVRNVRVPVRKYKGPRSGRVQVDPESRSKPGEYPRLDTGRLSKDIYWENRGQMEAIVGYTLDYALILETRRNRKLLRATLREMRPTINRILQSGPRLPGQER